MLATYYNEIGLLYSKTTCTQCVSAWGQPNWSAGNTLTCSWLVVSRQYTYLTCSWLVALVADDARCGTSAHFSRDAAPVFVSAIVISIACLWKEKVRGRSASNARASPGRAFDTLVSKRGVHNPALPLRARRAHPSTAVVTLSSKWENYQSLRLARSSLGTPRRGTFPCWRKATRRK